MSVQRATATTLATGVPTRQRLLQAAEELFGSRGYFGTQVTDITEHARTGVGTFYRYFADKEDILRVLLEEFFERIRGEMVRIRAGIEQRPPLEQVAVIRETFRVILGELTGRRDVTMTIFRFGYGVSDQVNAQIWRFVDTMTRDVASDIARAQSAGLLSVPQQELLAHCVTGTVLQVAHKLVVDPGAPLEAAVDTCTRFTLGGLSAFVTEPYLAAAAPVLRELASGSSNPGARHE